MKTIAMLLAAALSVPAFAQMYKCPTAGGNAYQEKPCGAKGGEVIDVTPVAVGSDESQIENAISLREVRIGMNEKQVIRAWGKPTKVNRTIGTGAASEQWIYDRGGIARTQYLYLEGGILKAAQGPSAK